MSDLIRRNTMDLKLRAQMEYEHAKAAHETEDRNAANIDYLAMMCDVEIPTEEEAEESDYLEESEDE